MSELIAELDRPVRPDYHMFGIADRGSVGEATPTPGQDWLGVGDTGVLISVGEDLVSPSLRLEVWDGPPPETPSEYEVQRTVQLLLPTGLLAVNEITGGWSDGLPEVVPGRYSVRITGWDREKTRRDYADLGYEWDTDEHEAGRAALAGQERYLIQLWLEAPTARLIDSRALKIHANYPLVAVADADSAYTVPLSGHNAVVLPTADAAALMLEHWDGPPPATGGHQHELHMPSGAVTVMHLHSIHADRNERSGGSIGRFFQVPRGRSRVLVSEELPKGYVVRFWPMMD